MSIPFGLQLNAVFAGAVLFAGLGCDASSSRNSSAGGPPVEEATRQTSPAPPSSASASASSAELRQRQAAFLNRIRDADPKGQTIDRALLNDQNELGLVLDRSVEMDKIPVLMRGMLAKMAEAFPGEDLTILAYAPSNPPKKIGTARLDARTRDATYTPEK